MPYYPPVAPTQNRLADLLRLVQSAPPYVPPHVMERMREEPRPWDTVERAPDGQKWGLNVPHEGAGRNYSYPITEEQAKTPDASPYFMNMPNMGIPGTNDPERAYNPTLPEEQTMNTPADRQAQLAWRRAGRYPEQVEAAQEFQRPKSLEEIFPADRYTNEAIRQMRPWYGMP